MKIVKWSSVFVAVLALVFVALRWSEPSPASATSMNPSARDTESASGPGLAAPEETVETRHTTAEHAGLGAIEVTNPFECVMTTPPKLSLSDERGQVVRTNSARGTTRFDGLEPGNYVLECSGTGWNAVTANVSVVGHETARIRLEPSARNGVRGQVVAIDGSGPIGKFQVVLEARRVHPDGTDERMALLPVDVDEPNGSFCIAALDVAGQQLRVRVDAGARGDATSEWLPFDGTHWLEGIVLEVRDLRASTASLAGRVVRVSDRAPVAGAHVRVLGPNVSLSDGWWIDGELMLTETEFSEQYERFPARFETRSASDGGFRIQFTPPRAARLLVMTPGLRPELTDVLTLVAGEDRELPDIALERGARLTGRIVTVTADELRVKHQAWLSGGLPRTLTQVDESGEFVFDGLTDGTWALEIRAVRDQGLLPILATRTVEVVDQRDVVLEIPLGGAGSIDGIRGHVRLPTDAAVRQWLAFVTDAEAVGLPETTAVVAEDGSFELVGVTPGDKLVVVAGLSEDNRPLAACVATVRVKPGAPTRVELDAARVRVSVRVERSELERRGESLQLEASQTQPAAFARLVPQLFGVLATDASGELTLHGLPPGHYSAAAAGLEPKRFLVPTEGPVTLELVLR